MNLAPTSSLYARSIGVGSWAKAFKLQSKVAARKKGNLAQHTRRADLRSVSPQKDVHIEKKWLYTRTHDDNYQINGVMKWKFFLEYFLAFVNKLCYLYFLLLLPEWGNWNWWLLLHPIQAFIHYTISENYRPRYNFLKKNSSARLVEPKRRLWTCYWTDKTEQIYITCIVRV